MDKTVTIWDCVTGKALRRQEGHTSEVSAVAFSPGGKHRVSVGDDASLRFWLAEPRGCLAVLHFLKEGFLWATPPTDHAPSGWLWTDREDLVTISSTGGNEQNPDPD